MTREQVKAILPDGCDEKVVTKLLNAFHSELVSYREKAQEAEDLLEKYEKQSNDILALQEKYDTDVAAARAEIDATKFDAMLKGVLHEKGARIHASVRALLDLDALKAADNPEAATLEAVHDLMRDPGSAFLFNLSGHVPRGGGSLSGGMGSSGMSSVERQIREGAGISKKE